MIGVLGAVLWRDPNMLAISKFRSNCFALFGTILLACIINQIFVYGISPGFRLHLLPYLPFELMMATLGIWGLAKYIFSRI
jgi:hypothetical protein